MSSWEDDQLFVKSLVARSSRIGGKQLGVAEAVALSSLLYELGEEAGDPLCILHFARALCNNVMPMNPVSNPIVLPYYLCLKPVTAAVDRLPDPLRSVRCGAIDGGNLTYLKWMSSQHDSTVCELIKDSGTQGELEMGVELVMHGLNNSALSRVPVEALFHVASHAPYDVAQDMADIIRNNELIRVAMLKDKLKGKGQEYVEEASRRGIVPYFQLLLDIGHSKVYELRGRYRLVLEDLVHHGATVGNIEALRFAKAQGFKNWARSGPGLLLTAAHYAAQKGFVELVDFLADETDVVAPQDKRGLTPIDYLVLAFVRVGNIQGLEHCRQKYNFSSWSKELTPNHDTAGHLAALNGDAKLVEYLRERGANFDLTNEDGNSVWALIRVHLGANYSRPAGVA